MSCFGVAYKPQNSFLLLITKVIEQFRTEHNARNPQLSIHHLFLIFKNLRRPFPCPTIAICPRLTNTIRPFEVWFIFSRILSKIYFGPSLPIFWGRGAILKRFYGQLEKELFGQAADPHKMLSVQIPSHPVRELTFCLSHGCWLPRCVYNCLSRVITTDMLFKMDYCFSCVIYGDRNM